MTTSPQVEAAAPQAGRGRWLSRCAPVALAVLAAGLLATIDGGAVQLGSPAFADPGNGNGGGNSNAGGNGGGNGHGGGNGGGHGGGNGGGNGGGDRGGPPVWANAGGNGNGGGNGQGQSDRGLARYSAAIDAQVADGHGNGNGNGPRELGDEVAEFSDSEVDSLLANGWQVPASRVGDGFANHGQRVRTFVAIARELGLSPSVGAQQANWGTPQENGLHDLSADVPEAREAVEEDKQAVADLSEQLVAAKAALAEAQAGGETGEKTVAELEAEVAALEAELATAEAQQAESEAELAALEAGISDAVAGVKPGEGPHSGWELENLDVDGDGVVSAADLVAARNGERPDEDGVL